MCFDKLFLKDCIIELEEVGMLVEEAMFVEPNEPKPREEDGCPPAKRFLFWIPQGFLF